jgi:hypothetical protein
MRVSQGLSATSTGSYHMLGGVHRQLKVLVAFDEAIVEQELLFAADIDWILCHGSVPYGDVWTYSARKSHGPFPRRKGNNMCEGDLTHPPEGRSLSVHRLKAGSRV